MSEIFKHLATALNDSGTMAYMWDVDADLFQWAGDLSGTWGLNEQDYPASSLQFNKFINPLELPQRLTALHACLNGPARTFTARYKMRRVNGPQGTFEETATLYIDEATGRRSLCGFIKPVADACDTPAVVRENNSVTMPETGLAHGGRVMVRARMEEESALPGQGFLLAAGLDRLSLANEAYGARFTDEIIEKTGQRLRQITNDRAYVARIDGDIFGLYYRQAAHGEMAAAAQSILAHFLSHPLQTSKGLIEISLSLGGIEVSSAARRDSSSFITKAEIAMQAAKDRGRACFVSYGEIAGQVLNQRMMLEAGGDFMKALKDKRVMLAFQPIVDSRTGKVSFHESLIRMKDKDGKIVAAGTFIPAIEQMGMSHIADRFALQAAIAELCSFPELSLAVNVSNQTLADRDWLRDLVSSLRDKPSVARRLIIEITETSAVRDMDQTARVIKTVKDLGCRVALDDFGAGYTAFSQIKNFKIDIVKIDKSFVRNIDKEENHIFIRTLQTLAQGVDVKTVGEGAETTADADRLMRDGIDYIQGYVYGFPCLERIWLPKDHAHRHIVQEKASDIVTPPITGRVRSAP